MRILDIDMDYFLDDVAHFKQFDGERLADDEFLPWDRKKVISFLEDTCGLNKYKGEIFPEHIGVFHAIRELVSRTYLSTPFDIVHIDAHADLGLGYSACQHY